MTRDTVQAGLLPPCREGTAEALLGDTIRRAVSRRQVDHCVHRKGEPKELKSYAKSTVYPKFYAEILPCFPGLSKRNISLVRIQSAQLQHNPLIRNNLLRHALWRDLRGLQVASTLRDLKLQAK